MPDLRAALDELAAVFGSTRYERYGYRSRCVPAMLESMLECDCVDVVSRRRDPNPRPTAYTRRARRLLERLLAMHRMTDPRLQAQCVRIDKIHWV